MHCLWDCLKQARRHCQSLLLSPIIAHEFDKCRQDAQGVQPQIKSLGPYDGPFILVWPIGNQEVAPEGEECARPTIGSQSAALGTSAGGKCVVVPMRNGIGSPFVYARREFPVMLDMGDRVHCLFEFFCKLEHPRPIARLREI